MADQRERSGHVTPVQVGAAAVGAAFLLVGILGFIPGVTTNFDDMTFAGHDSGAELLGIFQVNVLHNIVHLLFGVAGLAMAGRAASSRTYLIGGGAIYLALWLYGIAIDLDDDLNVVSINDADNWLHLGLGAAMVVLGLILPGTVEPQTVPAETGEDLYDAPGHDRAGVGLEN